MSVDKGTRVRCAATKKAATNLPKRDA